MRRQRLSDKAGQGPSIEASRGYLPKARRVAKTRMNCIVVVAVGDPPAEGKMSGLGWRVEWMGDWRISPVLKYV